MGERWIRCWVQGGQVVFVALLVVLFLQARARNLSEFVPPMHSGVVVGFECCILFLKLLELLGVT